MTARDGLRANAGIVFVMGSGRSGTTFLAKLIDASRRVLYRHEPDFTLRDPRIPFLPRVADYPQFVPAARDYVAALLRQRDAKTAGHLPLFAKDYRGPLGQATHQATFYVAKLAAKAGIAVAVPDMIAAGQPPVYVVKSVNSLSRTALFAAARPDIRILHIVRHPCAVVASLARGAESGRMRMAAYLDSIFEMPEAAGYPFPPEDMARRPPEQQYAFNWMVQNDKTYSELEGKANYRLISYERLCTNVMAELQSIADFAGLEVDPQMRDFARSLERSDADEAGYFDVQRNVRASLFKWRRELAPATIAGIREVVAASEIGRFCLAQEDAIDPESEARPAAD